MIVSSPAIVLKTFSYGETSLISRCFTKDKGKVSFIIKGAKSKKNLIAPYFQPLSYINIIFNENEKRELQIVSKVSFEKIWTKIPLSLKKMTLSQSILEISDFTLEKNDPYPRLFKILVETFQHFERETLDENICFWHYESKLLSEMGFLIDMEDKIINEEGLVSLEKTENSYQVLSKLIDGNVFDIDFDNISKIDKKNIKLSTPTANIAIRGTDFTATVDELGRSLVILLPDEFGDPSGTIVVSNNAGEVTLDQAYAATMVSSLDSTPTATVTINNITPGIIDNMFIVNPPKEVREEIEESIEQDADSGLLDVDFLEFNELEQDALKDTEVNLEYSELDIDFLEADFLRDLLDVIEDLDKTMARLGDRQSQGSGDFTLRGATVGKNNDSQYNIFVEDDGIVFYRDVQGVIRLKVQLGSSVKIDTIVEGYEGIIDLDGGDDSLIVITQE